MDWKKSTILITGGTGSFGRKFVEIMLNKYKPRKLIVFSRDEFKQHQMRLEFSSNRLRFFVGDVRDGSRLRRALSGVDLVVHAAALKQIPSCEYNPFEAVMTNIFGAKNVIDACIDCGVKKIMALSSDKAVSPSNLYGATKLCAEKIFVQGNAYVGRASTRFSCVRYGNVIGSRGSVVEVFQKQKPQGVLTITDPRMTRFWIGLEQGVEFVIHCIEEMKGGEIFVPKLPSMKTIDLAKAIAPECKIKYTGIRPGEKLRETLITEDESRHAVELSDSFIIEPENPVWDYKPRKKGRRLAEGFSYSSDINDEWISPGAIRKMAAKL